jgi:hypothetical protein
LSFGVVASRTELRGGFLLIITEGNGAESPISIEKIKKLDTGQFNSSIQLQSIVIKRQII